MLFINYGLDNNQQMQMVNLIKRSRLRINCNNELIRMTKESKHVGNQLKNWNSDNDSSQHLQTMRKVGECIGRNVIIKMTRMRILNWKTPGIIKIITHLEFQTMRKAEIKNLKQTTHEIMIMTHFRNSAMRKAEEHTDWNVVYNIKYNLIYHEIW